MMETSCKRGTLTTGFFLPKNVKFKTEKGTKRRV